MINASDAFFTFVSTNLHVVAKIAECKLCLAEAPTTLLVTLPRGIALCDFTITIELPLGATHPPTLRFLARRFLYDIR